MWRLLMDLLVRFSHHLLAASSPLIARRFGNGSSLLPFPSCVWHSVRVRNIAGLHRSSRMNNGCLLVSKRSMNYCVWCCVVFESLISTSTMYN
ncbi:hypothetical protein SDJN03_08552, partial [Cucurbita argyrosperma subsp. sororia]